MDNNIIKNSLIMLILDAISNVNDLAEVSCYKFEFGLSGSKIKGVVKVEFEEVE